MKVMSPKMMLGATVLTGILAYGMSSCNRDSNSTKQSIEVLKEAKDDYKRDSLNFINSDSIEAKENLARLEEQKKEYLEKNKPADMSIYDAEIFALITGDKNIKEMDKKIFNARVEVDNATGYTFKRSKERLAKAEESVKIRKLIDKMIRKDKLTTEEQEFVKNNQQEIINYINLEIMIDNSRHDALVELIINLM